MQHNISQAISYACVLPAILWFSTVQLQLKSLPSALQHDSNLISATHSEVPYFTYTYLPTYLLAYLLTYLLHGEESFLRS